MNKTECLIIKFYIKMKIADFKDAFWGATRVIMVAFAIALVMVSCGGRNSNAQQQQSAPETAQTAAAVQPSQTAQTPEITKVLSLGGLSESDVKPAGFVKFSPIDADEFKVETAEPLGEQGQKEWVKKIFDRCSQLSTDGKIYRAAYAGDNPSAYEYGDFDKRYSSSTNKWAYPCNGKYVSVSVGSLVTKKTCSISVTENED
jgi:hypothetical protein